MEITMPTMPSDYYLELADQRRARGDGHTEPEQAAADFAGAPGGHPRSPIRRRNTAPPQTLEQQMSQDPQARARERAWQPDAAVAPLAGHQVQAVGQRHGGRQPGARDHQPGVLLVGTGGAGAGSAGDHL